MEQEFSDFVETSSQQKFTKEEKVFNCQLIVLSYAISRLHCYAFLALKAFENLSLPKKIVVQMSNRNIREEETISVFHFLKQQKLENTFFRENTNFNKQKEEINSLMKDIRERMQNNLRKKMEIYFPRLSVVGLFHEQEEIMKSFLLWDDMYKNGGIENFSAYFYDIEKIAKIKNKFKKRNEDISFIGFRDLLLSINKKYNIKNKKISFYDNIKECQSFANFIKHKSQTSYNKLLKYQCLFVTLETTVDSHREPILSLDTFYRYIRAFENFWIHICKNVHKPMECNEFITETHKQIDLCVKQYQELPWHKEGKILDRVG